MTAIRKDLGNRIIMDHKIKLIYYLYFILLEIRKLDPQSKKHSRKLQIVNVYTNQVEICFT